METDIECCNTQLGCNRAELLAAQVSGGGSASPGNALDAVFAVRAGFVAFLIRLIADILSYRFDL